MIGAAAWIRTKITSLEWNFYVAVSTLVRVDLFKRPTIRRQRHIGTRGEIRTHEKLVCNQSH